MYCQASYFGQDVKESGNNSKMEWNTGILEKNDTNRKWNVFKEK